MKEMKLVSFENWVQGARKPGELEFRQAVHILCRAISGSTFLAENMVLKGAILLSIVYSSSRFTKDIDFSTDTVYEEFVIEEFFRELEDRLALAVVDLEYGLDCRIQSWKKNPKSDHASFPTLQISVGYAPTGSSAHRRLLRKQCSTTFRIDFSFNEKTREIEIVQMPDGGSISCYSLADIVAEKFRAIIQQVQRNRIRRQDGYDIYRLLETGALSGGEIKRPVLESLLLKSKSRGVEVNKQSLREPDVMERSRRDYALLSSEILEPLPPFDQMYETVRFYYESLAWDTLDDIA